VSRNAHHVFFVRHPHKTKRICLFSGEKLGLTISPDQVRTKPRQEDPYRWFLSERVKDERLFDSNLSDLSSGKFSRIRTALVNKEIEAVPPDFQEGSMNEV
jgi:hypothetical protein